MQDMVSVEAEPQAAEYISGSTDGNGSLSLIYTYTYRQWVLVPNLAKRVVFATCGLEEETSRHFVYSCPTLMGLRETHQQSRIEVHA